MTRKNTKRRSKTNKPIQHGSAWRIRWTDEHGKRRSETFGDREDAAFQLNRRLVAVEERRRGLRALSPARKTFAEAADLWLEVKHAKRSLATDRSFLRCHLLPEFGDVELREIGAREAARYEKTRAGRLAPNTIYLHLSLLISILRLAHQEEWLGKVPAIKKPKPTLRQHTEVDAAGVPHERFPHLETQDEIQRFLDAAREQDPLVFVLYAVPIYSGLRLGEVCGLTVASLDFDGRVMRIHRSYGGPTKTAKSRVVPILDPLLPLLRARANQIGSGLLFPNQGGGLLRRDAPYFRKARYFGRTLEAAGFPDDYITYHDLRHTFASHWMRNGGCIYRLQSILGHSSPKMTQRYAHLAPDVFKDDLDRLPSLQPALRAV
ncbi:MAG: site-specific integrase [Deltaproteobacteria bacterium]